MGSTAAGYRDEVLGELRSLVQDGRSDAPGATVDVLGRIGLVGYGVVHLLVAWIALEVAFGIPAASPDAEGAVGTLARSTGGVVALAVGAAGLVAFAVWQLVAAAVGFRWVSGGERVRKRVGAVAKAIAVTALAVLIVDYLVRTGVRGGSSAPSAAADVLALPGGRFLLAAVAVTILVIASTMVYTGLRRTFMGDLDVRRLSPTARRLVEASGAAGTLARAAAFGVVGLLVGSAALLDDPARAGGLDAALRALGSTGLGSGLLVVVALGFAAFGLFCFADAATRRA